MLKNGYSNGARATQATMIMRHRPTRQLLVWLVAVILVGALLYRFTGWSSGNPPETSVIIHKTAGEIDVKPWSEERWYVGPRNETELEKAALIMLVRYCPCSACLLLSFC